MDTLTVHKSWTAFHILSFPWTSRPIYEIKRNLQHD